MDWFGRRNHKVKRDSFTLIEESAAMLTGHFTTLLVRTGAGTPAWAEVNSLAHAQPAWLLDQLESQRQIAPERLGSWARARFDILQELIDLADGQAGRIEQLQRGCLIPLELRLMEPSLWSVLPSEVLILALTRLHAHPLALRHRMASPPEI